MSKGQKAALRMLQDFWSSLDEDRFEAQVLDCVSVILNYVPSLASNFNEEYVAFCKCNEFYRKPCVTRIGRQFFQACVVLKLIDLQGTILGGLCGGQFGWPLQQLNSVDIRQLSMTEADELRKRGFFHWYSVDQFTQEQLEWIMRGGVVRHTFGVLDVDTREVGEVFEMIED